ncbi:MAG TPA: DUF308 domain-containing protein [Candidatus Methylomirabilis sp.]|nr:DUF308 domain-containing protein [Candidatus Methylomirabilis sp.]
MRVMANPLVRNWPMLAARGGLALAFGLTVLTRRPTLGGLVILFAVYALLDGACALAWALHAAVARLEWWPVALEGVVSVALGTLALVWPFVPHRMITAIAFWGVVTGILEITVAVRLPRELASHWLLGAGGVASVFLGLLVGMLPYAATTVVLTAIGVYALAFGILVSLAALRLRRLARRSSLELAGRR